jgi:hypothetical protein
MKPAVQPVLVLILIKAAYPVLLDGKNGHVVAASVTPDALHRPAINDKLAPQL